MSHPYFFISSENAVYSSNQLYKAEADTDNLQNASPDICDKKIIKGRICSNDNQTDITTIELLGQDFHHLAKVLRAKKGDLVELSDNRAFRFKAEISSLQNDRVLLEVKSAEPVYPKKPFISLYLCVLKKEAMELAIQKTVEIGIDEIAPVLSSRVIVKLDKTGLESKTRRWQQIATEASKQCKRDFECRIRQPMALKDIDVAAHNAFFGLFEPGSSQALASHKTGRNDCGPDFYKAKDTAFNFDGSKLSKMEKLAYITGPEGGFSSEETALLAEMGALPVNFGKNILRSETAAIYFLSVLDYIVKNQ